MPAHRGESLEYPLCGRRLGLSALWIEGELLDPGLGHRLASIALDERGYGDRVEVRVEQRRRPDRRLQEDRRYGQVRLYLAEALLQVGLVLAPEGVKSRDVG